jgi:hypothetical protein
MTKERLDDFIRFYAGLVVQFSTIAFSTAFMIITVMAIVKLLYNIFNLLFLA